MSDIKYRSAQIKAVSGANRFKFVASDESVDRYGDVVRAAGWELGEFRQNPVLLWGHDSSEPPIGTVDDIRVEGKQLIAETSFASDDANPFAGKIRRLVEAGIVKAVSVGFLPIKMKQRTGEKGEFLGYEFIKQSLMELSVVSVPANPNAVALAKSMHFKQQDLDRIFAPVVTDAMAMRMRQLEIKKRV